MTKTTTLSDTSHNNQMPDSIWDAMVSYRRKNSDIVFAVIELLETNPKYKVTVKEETHNPDFWIDAKHIPPGERWEEAIYKGIEQSGAILIFITQDYVTSKYCYEELVHARKHNKKIIGVKLETVDEAKRGRDLAERNWYSEHNKQDVDQYWKDLKSINWVIYNPKEGLDKLAEKILVALTIDIEYFEWAAEIQYNLNKWQMYSQTQKNPFKKLFNSYLLTGNLLEIADKYLERALLINQDKDQQSDNLLYRQMISPTADQIEYIAKSHKHAQNVRRLGLATSISIIATILFGILFISYLSILNKATEKLSISQQMSEDGLRGLATNFGVDAIQSVEWLDIDWFPSFVPRLNTVNFFNIAYMPHTTQANLMIHSERVHDIVVHPYSDAFVTISTDKTIYWWERDPNLQDDYHATAFVTNENIPFEFPVVDILDADLTFSEDGAKMYAIVANDSVDQVGMGSIYQFDVSSQTFEGCIDVFRISFRSILFVSNVLYVSGGSEVYRVDLNHPDMALSSSCDGSDSLAESINRFAPGYNPDNGIAYGVFTLAYNSSNTALYTGGDEGRIIEYNLSTLGVSVFGETTIIDVHERGNTDDLLNISRLSLLDEDQGIMIAAMSDGALHSYNRATGETFYYDGHRSSIFDVAVHPTQSIFATASRDTSVRIWQMGISSPIMVLEDPRTEVWTLAFSNDGRYLITGSDAGEIRIWDLQHGAQINRNDCESNAIIDFIMSNNETLIANHSGQLITHNIDTLPACTNLPTINFDTGEGRERATVAPNTDYAVTTDYSGNVTLWNFATGEELQTLTTPDNAIYTVEFSPDGTRLAVGGDLRQVYLYNVINSQLQHVSCEIRMDSQVFATIFLDNQTIIASDASGLVREFRIQNENCSAEHILQDDDSRVVQSLHLTEDGQLLTGHDDGTATLWDLPSYTISEPLSGHADFVVSIDSTSEWILTGSRDGTIILWDRQSQQIHAQYAGLEPQLSPVYAVRFNADELSFFSGHADGSIRQWRIDELADLLLWIDNNYDFTADGLTNAIRN